MVRKYESADISCIRKIWVDSHIRQDGFISTQMWRSGLITLDKSIEENDVYVCVEHGSIYGFIQVDENRITGLFASCDRHYKKTLSQLLNYVKNISAQLTLIPFLNDSDALKVYSLEGFKQSPENSLIYTYESGNS